jgi:hypothetical protein
MIRRQPVLILAPHADDEVIGCWSVLLDPEVTVSVVYFFELTDERKAEALVCCASFGFDLEFADFNTYEIPDGYHEVYVPSRKDWHADHKMVNAKYRNKATKFYSVDMACGKLVQVPRAKQKLLNDIYPSQASLWENNDKYWLFEDIQETDYDEYRTLAWTQPSGRTLAVTVPVNDVDKVLGWHLTNNRGGQFGHNRREFMNDLLAICTGKVTVTYDNITVEA